MQYHRLLNSIYTPSRKHTQGCQTPTEVLETNKIWNCEAESENKANKLRSYWRAEPDFARTAQKPRAAAAAALPSRSEGKKRSRNHFMAARTIKKNVLHRRSKLVKGGVATVAGI
jgi:hypothetical protein